MINLLPPDFSGEKYGLSYRLVNDQDAPFILSLRSDSWHTRYIHSTENDLVKQLDWMKNYKQRESQGRDYYFIYSFEGRPVGVSRVYNIFEYYGTAGSWICKPNSEPSVVLGTYLILHDIMFEIIGLDLSVFDVRKDNLKVQRIHKLFGAVVIGESDIDYYFSLFKNHYFDNREKMLKYI